MFLTLSWSTSRQVFEHFGIKFVEFELDNNNIEYSICNLYPLQNSMYLPATNNRN